jgi:hypothetical protein
LAPRVVEAIRRRLPPGSDPAAATQLPPHLPQRVRQARQPGHRRAAASAIGALYRHTTPDMAARVVAAVEERLVVVLATAEAALGHQLG